MKIDTSKHCYAQRCVFVVSDLHLSVGKKRMMSSPQTLANFIESLPGRIDTKESLELVINGDFIDFLAVPRREPDEDGNSVFDAFTPTEELAVDKLEDVIIENREVFTSLEKHIEGGFGLTIIVGNHDVELCLPKVQETFRKCIGDRFGTVRFIDDGTPLRIGRLLIEHGNRYDYANQNDWTILRALRSALMRGETNTANALELSVSAGSRIVEKVVNPLKCKGYSFVDLLKPQGPMVAYVMLSLEPKLKHDWPAITRLFHGAWLQYRNRNNSNPTKTSNVSSQYSEQWQMQFVSDLEIFGEEYASMESISTSVNVGAGIDTWWNLFMQRNDDGLAAIIHHKREIPSERLAKIRVALRAFLQSNNDINQNEDTDSYGIVASRIINSQVADMVVMGHTHQPCHFGPDKHATYINTGNWTDTIQIPEIALEETLEGNYMLQNFLKDLLCNDETIRTLYPAWAEVRLSPSGDIFTAYLCREGSH